MGGVVTHYVEGKPAPTRLLAASQMGGGGIRVAMWVEEKV